MSEGKKDTWEMLTEPKIGHYTVLLFREPVGKWTCSIAAFYLKPENDPGDEEYVGKHHNPQEAVKIAYKAYKEAQ